MFGENRMDGAPQIPDAFAVDDAYLKHAALLARSEIIHHEVFHLARLATVCYAPKNR